MRYFLDHWLGKLSLSQSFWINLIAISTFGCLLEYLIHGYFQLGDSRFITYAIGYFIFLHVFIFSWQVVGVLRACDNNLKNFIASGWTRSAQLFVLTVFAATLIWGISLTQQLWKLNADKQLIESESKIKPDYSIEFSDNVTVSIDGIISPGITKELKKRLATKTGIEVVQLNSTGGNIFEARGIAKLIYENRLNTHVLENCFSSCTTAFIAGHSRSLEENAKLGFHQYRLNSKKLFAPSVNVKKELQKDRLSFLKQGVSEVFLDKAFSTPYDDMWFPKQSELIEAGIIHSSNENIKFQTK